MSNEVHSPNVAGGTTRILEVEDSTRRLLEIAAAQEGRAVASVLEDAVALYLRSRSEGYRAHLELAHRFLNAPLESDERSLAGAELSAALARERGQVRQVRGGPAEEVRARLHQRQAHTGDS